MPITLETTLTCPECGTAHREVMTEDSCQFFYTCSSCGVKLRPAQGDCCVFCTYADVPCPPIQAARQFGDTPKQS